MRRHSPGQVTIEYFLIFAVVIAVTLLGATLFDDNMRSSLVGFFTELAKKMSTPP